MRKTREEGKIKTVNKSKAELDLGDRLIARLGSDRVVRSHTITLADQSHIYPDIYIPRFDLIIEFYGTYWHADPRKYSDDVPVHDGIPAKEIWKRDAERLKKFGGDSYVVWESDYKKDPESIVESLVNMLDWDYCY